MAILCQSGLSTFVQGYVILEVGRPQDYGQIFTSLQHWLKVVCGQDTLYTAILLCNDLNVVLFQGHVYAEATDFHCSERGWLAYARGLLLYKCLDSVGTSTLTVINPDNLQEQQTFNLEGMWVILFQEDISIDISITG